MRPVKLSKSRKEPTENDFRQLASTIHAFWKNIYGPKYRESRWFKDDSKRLKRVRDFVRSAKESQASHNEHDRTAPHGHGFH